MLGGKGAAACLAVFVKLAFASFLERLSTSTQEDPSSQVVELNAFLCSACSAVLAESRSRIDTQSFITQFSHLHICDQHLIGDEHVQNEVHALFFCQDHRACELRNDFSSLFTFFEERLLKAS
jgi:hypothetical protein